MKFLAIEVTARSIMGECINDQPYYAPNPYHVKVNGEYVIRHEARNVFALYDLVPNTVYQVELEDSVTGEKVTEEIKTLNETVRLNVKNFGAVGDGITEDTGALQAAILCCPNQGTVYVPKGIYLCAPLFLKSHMTLELAEGATILGVTDRSKYPILPGYTVATNEKDEYYLGSWEGNPLSSMASLITGVNVEDVKIIGKGVLDGNGQNGDWWIDCKKKKRAWRPRMLFLNHCENITVQGITIQNSPAWTVHPYFTNHVKFLDLTITNPYNSHNTDGIDPESCKDVTVVGVKISVGDDCIAIKSGKIFMGQKFKKPTEDMVVRNCLMEKGHGAVVVGSEIAGGVKNVMISKCVFRQTDRGLRIKTRRGRGKDSVLDEIHFSQIHMDEVMTPFVINMYYYCDPDGKSEYVWSKKPLPVDEMTPSIGYLSFKNIVCERSEVAATFFYGLPESPIQRVELENVKISFKEAAKSDVPAMMDGVEPMSKKGVFARYINTFELNNVDLEGYEGPCFDIEEVKLLKNNG